MHEGDTCFTSTRRSSSVNDFDEQAATNERQAWFMIVVGSIGTVGSLAGCVSAGRRRFAGRESVALSSELCLWLPGGGETCDVGMSRPHERRAPHLSMSRAVLAGLGA
jgi:hypothetical protein